MREEKKTISIIKFVNGNIYSRKIQFIYRKYNTIWLEMIIPSFDIVKIILIKKKINLKNLKEEIG